MATPRTHARDISPVVGGTAIRVPSWGCPKPSLGSAQREGCIPQPTRLHPAQLPPCLRMQLKKLLSLIITVIIIIAMAMAITIATAITNTINISFLF